MPIKFGPSGTPDAFYEAGGKHSVDLMKWIADFGLDCNEYQCARGCRVSADTAQKIGKAARENGVALSVHAPYYINFATEGEKREQTIGYILQSLEVAKNLGATRIVAHTGACAKISREHAMALARQTMAEAVRRAREGGYEGIFICPETMGKINQLGTVEEVCDLCTIDEEMLLPTIDFGHLYARSIGVVEGYEAFGKVFDMMENALGHDRTKIFHGHFSHIEYTQNGGEKKHLTFADGGFGPDFAPIAQLLYERGYEPMLVCESAGTQAADALEMKNIYGQVAQGKAQES